MFPSNLRLLRALQTSLYTRLRPTLRGDAYIKARVFAEVFTETRADRSADRPTAKRTGSVKISRNTSTRSRKRQTVNAEEPARVLTDFFSCNILAHKDYLERGISLIASTVNTSNVTVLTPARTGTMIPPH